jgi:hypothetical protein
MPGRQAGAKSKKKPQAVVAADKDAAAIELTTSGKKLYDEINGRWRLDPLCEKLLMAAAIHLSHAERCNAIVEKEGRHYLTRFDEPKPHPLLAEASKNLVSHTNALAKLMTALE